MVHGDTQGLRPQAKNKDTNISVLDRTCGVIKGGEVLRPNVQGMERSDPGGTIIPYNF